MSQTDYKYNGKIVNTVRADYGNVNPNFTAEKHYPHIVNYMKYFILLNEMNKPENKVLFDKYVQSLASTLSQGVSINDAIDNHFKSTKLPEVISSIVKVIPEIASSIKERTASFDSREIIVDAGFDIENISQHFIDDVQSTMLFDEIFPGGKYTKRDHIIERLSHASSFVQQDSLENLSRANLAKIVGSVLATGEMSNTANPKNHAESLIKNENISYVITEFKNNLCSSLSRYNENREPLSRDDKKILSQLLKSDLYTILSPTGVLKRLTVGSEFTTDGKTNWRIKQDINNNLRIAAVTKQPIHNLAKNNDGTYKVLEIPENSEGINVTIPQSGDLAVGEKVLLNDKPEKHILELDENSNPIAVFEDREFTILTGCSVNPTLWAKRGSRGEFAVYNEDKSGLVGHFTTNMTENRRNGKKGKFFSECQLDKEHSNVVINISGSQQSVAIKEKECEYQLSIYKDIERKGFVSYFNVLIPGKKQEEQKSGIKGILYPSVGKQPARFTQKAADGQYYNTASFFTSKGNSMTGVLRDLNDAIYMANLSRKPDQLKQKIADTAKELKELKAELRSAGIDPSDDEQCFLLQKKIRSTEAELAQFNETYTDEEKKRLNDETWQKSDIYHVEGAEFLLKKDNKEYVPSY